MKSYGTASRTTLGTLLGLRAKGERDAEQALAAAAGGLRKAEAEAARLVGETEAARAAVAAARRDGGNVGAGGAGGGERAADAQTRRRFWARLEAEAVFGALARRVASLEMTGDPTRRLNNTLRGLDTLPLRVVPA